jgi:hypothetical protein
MMISSADTEPAATNRTATNDNATADVFDPILVISLPEWGAI